MNWVAFRHRPQSGETQTTTVFPMSLFSQVQQLGTFDWPEGAGAVVLTQTRILFCIEVFAQKGHYIIFQVYQHDRQQNTIYLLSFSKYINMTDNKILFTTIILTYKYIDWNKYNDNHLVYIAYHCLPA